MNLRRILIVGTIGVGAAVAMASAAWACATVQNTAAIDLEDPATATTSPAVLLRGIAGTHVRVHGYHFATGPVTVGFGNPADLPLATVNADSNGEFIAQITIPPFAPGVTYVKGFGAPKAGFGESQPAPFEVIVPGVDPGPGPLPVYKNDGVASAAGFFGDEQPTPDPGGQTSNPGGQTSFPVRGGTGGVGVPVPGLGVATAPVGAVANPAALPGLTSPSDNREVATANSPQGAIAGQSPVDNSVAAALAGQSPLPSSQSFARDLWSGFTKGAGPTQASSLLDARSSGHTPGLALGMGLALGATVALCMGFGLAEARRRRALA